VAGRLDRVVVINVECTCWQGGEPPPGEVSEIIEVGACLLDPASGEIGERASVLVRPSRSRVSAFCARRTTLTPEMVASGLLFRDACALLERAYGARERAWASYGDYDRLQFERQCGFEGVRYPFGPSHLNVKTLCALMQGRPSEVALPDALADFGLDFRGTHHRGFDDAWNIARLLAALLRPGARGAFDSEPF
jgi:inhibitor of KinA sporulation pathway (predicted exonuclease)